MYASQIYEYSVKAWDSTEETFIPATELETKLFTDMEHCQGRAESSSCINRLSQKNQDRMRDIIEELSVKLSVKEERQNMAKELSELSLCIRFHRAQAFEIYENITKELEKLWASLQTKQEAYGNSVKTETSENKYESIAVLVEPKTPERRAQSVRIDSGVAWVEDSPVPGSRSQSQSPSRLFTRKPPHRLHHSKAKTSCERRRAPSRTLRA